MLKSIIIHLKETYKFCFDHFLEKRTVFILVKKNIVKKMLRNKIVRFKKIYKFYFDHFLIKFTVFVLIVINTIKIKNSIFSPNFMRCEKMLQIKAVVFKKKYKFYIKQFLIGIIVFLIKIKNAIE